MLTYLQLVRGACPAAGKRDFGCPYHFARSRIANRVRASHMDSSTRTDPAAVLEIINGGDPGVNRTMAARDTLQGSGSARGVTSTVANFAMGAAGFDGLRRLL